jgi:hypothetical protein
VPRHPIGKGKGAGDKNNFKKQTYKKRKRKRNPL